MYQSRGPVLTPTGNDVPDKGFPGKFRSCNENELAALYPEQQPSKGVPASGRYPYFEVGANFRNQSAANVMTSCNPTDSRATPAEHVLDIEALVGNVKELILPPRA